MSWFDDGDGWRDESTEGPFDCLKTYMESGNDELTIYRGLPRNRENDQYRIIVNGETIGYEPTEQKAKDRAVLYWKEQKKWKSFSKS